MDTNEKKITRYLRRKNESIIEADKMLMDKYERVFGNDYLERVEVIDIQTAYNDYKKLHDDLYELAKSWEKNIICFSSSTDILDIVKMKNIRKVCKKKRIMVEQPLLNVSKICAFFLSLLNISHIMCSFILGAVYPIPTKIVLLILCLCLLATLILIAQQTQKYNDELLEKLNDMDEDSLINMYSCLVQKKSLLKNEGIFLLKISTSSISSVVVM